MADTGTLPPQAIFAHGDLADLLPAPSAERLRRLRQHAKDKHAVIPDSQQRLAVSEDLITSAKRIEQLVARRGARRSRTFRGLPPGQDRACTSA
jgi:hypothetical protein